jgi:hypothetical protein
MRGGFRFSEKIMLKQKSIRGGRDIPPGEETDDDVLRVGGRRRQA